MQVDAASDAQDMSICPGVRIEDMGHKMGCNGVDNGKLWFDGEHHLTTDAAAMTGLASVKLAPPTHHMLQTLSACMRKCTTPAGHCCELHITKRTIAAMQRCAFPGST
jgi:hypothetical protein